VKNQTFIGVLLILVGLLSVPFIKESIGRLFLFAIVGGVIVFGAVLVVGGIILVALRGAG